MPRNESSFQSGEDVTDRHGNQGRVYRFWSEMGKSWYWRVRLIAGPLRDAGRVWTSAYGFRPLVDFEPKVEKNRCCACGWEFWAPKVLPCGSEFCRRCSGGDPNAWDPDYVKDQQIAEARKQLDREMDLLRKKGA